MNFPFFTLDKILMLVSFVFFYVTIVLISGIDKENFKIEKSVLLFGLVVQTIYILYLYISETVILDIHRYEIYLVIELALFVLDTISLKIKGKSLYIVQIMMFLTYILMFVPFDAFYLIIILGLFYSLIYGLWQNVKKALNSKSDILSKDIKTDVPVGFCIGVVSIIIVLANNFCLYY